MSLDLEAAALVAFWTYRAEHAPTAAELERHVQDELRYFRAISGD